MWQQEGILNMKIGMMLGFEESINTITTIAREAENAGINSLYTVDAGRSATVTAAAVINATEKAQVGTLSLIHI